jgi:hypothetical protein
VTLTGTVGERGEGRGERNLKRGRVRMGGHRPLGAAHVLDPSRLNGRPKARARGEVLHRHVRVFHDFLHGLFGEF